jgi:hypothetical protein
MKEEYLISISYAQESRVFEKELKALGITFAVQSGWMENSYWDDDENMWVEQDPYWDALYTFTTGWEYVQAKLLLQKIEEE